MNTLEKGVRTDTGYGRLLDYTVLSERIAAEMTGSLPSVPSENEKNNAGARS